MPGVVARALRATLASKISVKAVTVRLSDDELTLSWEARVVSKPRKALGRPARASERTLLGRTLMRGDTLRRELLALGERRSFKFTDFLTLLVGQQSKIWTLYREQNYFEAEDFAHLSLTLVLLGTLPPLPEDEFVRRPGLKRKLRGIDSRETLDLSFDDELAFGLWVAALRALMDRIPPTEVAPYPSPVAPVNRSARGAILSQPPPDATELELVRDTVLVFLVTARVFVYLAGVWALLVLAWGAFLAFLLLGWTGIEPYNCPGQPGLLFNTANWTGSGECVSAMDWFNVCIQILTLLFTYVAFITLPWRLANYVHLRGRHRSCDVGLDFYGRPSDGVWFHTPLPPRRKIVRLLLLNTVFTLLAQLARLIWSDYTSSQSMPGAIFINLTFVSAVVFGIWSGALQGAVEGSVRKANPGRFPPTLGEVMAEQWHDWYAAWQARRSVAREVRAYQTSRTVASRSPKEVTAEIESAEGVSRQSHGRQPSEDIDEREEPADVSPPQSQGHIDEREEPADVSPPQSQDHIDEREEPADVSPPQPAAELHS
ncbi:hypothetical protein AB1Y20_007810 [Prymnesium parvum]|uniref:Autophagy-related protein 9 n=1 Tax=Prymnesium parvum TaxID=97485 RepID=A0AB34IUS0_PRYPA